VIPVKALARAIRPAQWTKNAVVAAPLVFALGDPGVEIALPHLLRAVVAMAAFCLVSSAVYLANDVLDRDKDRNHPQKKFRPVAAGDLSVSMALGAAGGLALCGLLAARLLAPGAETVLLGYLVLQAGYSLWLKRIALVDILIIAAGFVLRALAGAAAVPAPVSPWLLLCTLLLALFLALCKRRHELVADGGGHGNARTSLRDYNARLLDQLISIVASATLVAYAVYTFWPDTVEKFGTHALGFTIPYVIFGLFRYLDLVYRQDLGGRPEQILLTDWPLLLDVALYGATVVGILWFYR